MKINDNYIQYMLALYTRWAYIGYIQLIKELNMAKVERIKESAYLSKQLSDWLNEYAKEVGASKSAIVAMALQELKESKK